MTRLTPPYFKWRGGRPRMEPGPGLRKLGIRGVSLRGPEGWLARGPALDRGWEIARAWQARAEGQKAAGDDIRTIATLWARFERAPDFASLREATKVDYCKKARILLAERGDVPVETMDRRALKAWWRALRETRGHATANGVLAVLRLLYAFGEDIGWVPRGANPAARLKLSKPAPRANPFTAAEAALLVETADSLDGFASVGDALVLALHTGQRPADLIALPQRIATDGRIDVQQSKRGACVSVPLTSVARARCRAALARANRIAPALLLNEATGRPYDNTEQLSKRFRTVRAAAVATLDGEAAAQLAAKSFYDCRATYLTRAHRAGIDAYGRAAVSGHARATQVANEQHYVAADRQLADSAQVAYEDFLNRENVKV